MRDGVGLPLAMTPRELWLLTANCEIDTDSIRSVWEWMEER